MPINWSAEMDRKLLLAILKVHDVQIDKEKVAEELSTEEQPCTTMAIQKRLQAIRTMIKDGTGNEATPKAKATSRKRGAADFAANAGTPSKKAKGGKGKNVRAAFEDAGGDEDGEGQHPFKMESGDEDVFAR